MNTPTLILLLAAAAVLMYLGLTYDQRPTHRSTGARSEPTPEVSRFIKGLVISMRDTPDQWARHSDWGDPCWSHASGLFVTMWSEHWGLHNRMHVVSQPKLSPIDHDALMAAFMTYLEEAAQSAIERAAIEAQAVKAAQQARERAPFEALGCPPDKNLS